MRWIAVTVHFNPVCLLHNILFIGIQLPGKSRYLYIYSYRIVLIFYIKIIYSEQVKITGFDDSLLAALYHPSISSIRQFVSLVAEKTVSLLFTMMDGKMPDSMHNILPVRMIELIFHFLWFLYPILYCCHSTLQSGMSSA